MLENRNRAPNWSGAEPPPPLYISGTPRRITQLVVSLWLLGWLLLEVSRWGDLLVNARVTTGIWFLWRALWFGVGLAVAWALVWVAAGKHESLERVGDHLWRVRRVGPFRHRTSALVTEVSGLRTEARDSWLRDLVTVLLYWAGGNGRVSYTAGPRRQAVGPDLDEIQARTLRDLLAQRLPAAAGRVTDGPSGRAALRMGVVGIGMFLWLASGLITTPAALYFDRGSCGLASPAMPESPIDVRSMRPSGLVRLAPLGTFPEAEARALAAHFRATYGTAVEVEPRRPWPKEAFDTARGQLNAWALIHWMDRYQRASDVTLIALTDDDLFIPGYGWRYAYGYRRTDRHAAVVSTWRMALGCLVVVPATASLRTARLRKMVGKNIGLLHYGLQQQADPASMLYRDVGGPQDLDLMSEQF